MPSLAAALIQASPTMFAQNPTDMRIALSMVKDASQILALLLEGGQSIVAGRLVGAFRNINQNRIADTILKTMEKAGYNVRESNPFENKITIPLSSREQSPYGNRIRLMWHQMREIVIRYFSKQPGIPRNKKNIWMPWRRFI